MDGEVRGWELAHSSVFSEGRREVTHMQWVQGPAEAPVLRRVRSGEGWR